MYEAFTKPGAAGTGGGCWVDVRDIALAHVRALQKQAAGGERIIVAAGAFKWQDWRSYPWLFFHPSAHAYAPPQSTPLPSRPSLHTNEARPGQGRMRCVCYRDSMLRVLIIDYETLGPPGAPRHKQEHSDSRDGVPQYD
jgi:nucleoside-diphosphate-sugar epimerase